MKVCFIETRLDSRSPLSSGDDDQQILVTVVQAFSNWHTSVHHNLSAIAEDEKLQYVHENDDKLFDGTFTSEHCVENDDAQSERAGEELDEDNWLVKTFQVVHDLQNNLMAFNKNIPGAFEWLLQNF